MSLVTREDHGRVSVLTLNNPPANGYSHAMHRALDEHVVRLRMDTGTDVIVLRGAGERFFCAGADIDYLQSLAPDEKYAFCLHANETLLRLENTPKLVIAALNGHCVGGGMEIALACDLRIAMAGSAKVGLPEVTLGVLPGTGGTQRLTRVLGRSRALQWMVEGRNVSVEEAHAVGLVHEVWPATGWWERVLAYAQGFTRPHKAAEAVGLIKRAVLGGADLPLEAGLALERELQMRLFTAPDAKEGIAAFVEKRPARFTGRAGPPPGPVREGAAAGPVLDRAAQEGERAGANLPAIPPRASEAGGHDDFADLHEGHADDSTGDPLASVFDAPRARPGDLDLHRTRIPDSVLNLVPRDLVDRFLVIPVKRTGEGSLLVAMVDPSNAEAIEALREETGLAIEAVRAPELDLRVMAARYYRA